MPRQNRTADVFAACLRHTLPGGAIALLLVTCLAVLPRPVGSVEAGTQLVAEEAQSNTDKDADTDKTGTHEEEKSDGSGDKNEGDDKKRKSYQGSTEPSY